MTIKKDSNKTRYFDYLKRYISLKEVGSFYLTIAIPLFYILNLFLIARFPQTINLPFTLIVFGIVLAYTGMIIWFISMIQLGKSFGVLPQKQKKVKIGIYKYLNHPMYIGISLAYIGLGLASQSIQGLLATSLLLIPLLVFRAYFEEAKLK